MKKQNQSIAIQSARQNAMTIARAKWSCSGLPFSALRSFEDAEFKAAGVA